MKSCPLRNPEYVMQRAALRDTSSKELLLHNLHNVCNRLRVTCSRGVGAVCHGPSEFLGTCVECEMNWSRIRRIRSRHGKIVMRYILFRVLMEPTIPCDEQENLPELFQWLGRACSGDLCRRCDMRWQSCLNSCECLLLSRSRDNILHEARDLSCDLRMLAGREERGCLHTEQIS